MTKTLALLICQLAIVLGAQGCQSDPAPSCTTDTECAQVAKAAGVPDWWMAP
jgi:hypothetical protein